MNNFEEYKKDPKHYIEESHDECINDTDIRREEIQLMFKEVIDNYYEELLKEINLEKESKLNKVDEKISSVDSKKAEIESIKIDENLDVYSKINAFKNNQNSIDDGINLVSNIQEYLTQSKFKLTDSNNEIDVEDLFGELYLRENTSFIYNEDEIGDDNRSEATVQLVIKDFSKFTKKKNSKRCRVKNFEWSMLIKISNDCEEEEEKEKGKRIGFYLQCNSMDGLSRFSTNVNAQFTLLDSKNQNNDLTKCGNFYFDKEKYQGFDSFFEFENLEDLSSYFNREDDSITIKLTIK
ncbi:ubiquitin carboxyl-terminal hydrolase 7 isoform X2 [Brachionus plicatilis]|uniref:Ubiquitin carboxyl-terminal hydrolase 7 isoform X2 n=1 Tax=Brachionus plicatilis TaxID=10195 RepID=A0A3M7PWC4_BRAPC|nr:ubiquitin carboxyl-terminal hydrolase 7 isoform X2 [Brachionus plicatilis]